MSASRSLLFNVIFYSFIYSFITYPLSVLSGLTILGASYGKVDETVTVSNNVLNDELSLPCNNGMLGDGWPFTRKACTVIYSYNYPSGSSLTPGTQFDTYVAIVEEDSQLIITQGSTWPKHTQVIPNNNEFIVLGASYGRSDETGICKSYSNIHGLSIQAHNNVFGDSWPGIRKALTVVYQYGTQSPDLDIVEEDQYMFI